MLQEPSSTTDPYTESDEEILSGEILRPEERSERKTTQIEPWVPVPAELLAIMELLPAPTRAAPL
jgi:hypothetical protein